MVTCPGCSTQAFLECTCPEDHLLALGGHRQDCSHFNIDANLVCPADSGCCAEQHDHAARANACPGGHEASCPEDPGKCGVWKGAIADAFNPNAATVAHPLLRDLADGDDPPPCPGGHCHKDIADCTVCRPLVITVLPGTSVAPVFGAVAGR